MQLLNVLTCDRFLNVFVNLIYCVCFVAHYKLLRCVYCIHSIYTCGRMIEVLNCMRLSFQMVSTGFKFECIQKSGVQLSEVFFPNHGFVPSEICLQNKIYINTINKWCFYLFPSLA